MTETSPASTLPPLGTVQTRTQLLDAAGSRTARAFALRQAGGGAVVGLAITRRRNPDAPDLVVIGGSPRPAREAQEMVAAGTPLPVWVRDRPRDGWTYTGLWQPLQLDTGAAGRRDARASAPDRFSTEDPPPVGVLRLSPVGQVHRPAPS